MGVGLVFDALSCNCCRLLLAPNLCNGTFLLLFCLRIINLFIKNLCSFMFSFQHISKFCHGLLWKFTLSWNSLFQCTFLMDRNIFINRSAPYTSSRRYLYVYLYVASFFFVHHSFESITLCTTHLPVWICFQSQRITKMEP